MDRKGLAVIFSFCLFNYGLSIPVSDFLNAITVKNCGTSIIPPKSPDRIVGGTNVRHGSYPWIVSLQEEDEDGVFQHMCGGSVLNENWIVTAAHCIDFVKRPWMYQALVGLNKLSKEDAKSVQLLKISKIVMHKNYDDGTFYNDIALLRTAKPIDIAGSKGYVNGICLPTSDKDPTGYARVIGWGHTVQDGENSDTLKEVVLPMIPRDLCNEAYDDDPFDGFDDVNENMICAGMTGKDSCQNDSGGPLFQTNTKGVSTLIGIVSHGAGCGEKYYPGVYTKVSKYRDWMKKIIEQ